MINNDVMRSIRYMLDLGDSKVVDIIQLADPQFPIQKADVQGEWAPTKKAAKSSYKAALQAFKGAK